MRGESILLWRCGCRVHQLQGAAGVLGVVASKFCLFSESVGRWVERMADFCYRCESFR